MLSIQRRTRRTVVRVALPIAGGLLCWALLRLSDPSVTPPDDFVAYWAAGRVNVAGGNPYDPDQILPIQRTAMWMKDHAYRIWYPPWVLPLITPTALLPYAFGRLVWFALHLCALIVSADMLWRHYGGAARHRGLAWIIGFTFAPSMLVWKTGQIGPLMLLGLVGFLVLERRRLWLSAGASLILATIKPQLLPVFWLAFVLWSIRERQARPILGAAATGLLLLAFALVTNSALMGQFVRMSMFDPPEAIASSVGVALRLLARGLLGRDMYWLLFLPSLVGAGWLTVYWRTHRHEWRWSERTPPLVFASLATAPYCWVYDEVLLLVGVMQVAAAMGKQPGWTRSHTRIVQAYILINVLILVMNLMRVHPFWYVWTPFAFLALYAGATANVIPPSERLDHRATAAP